MQDNLHIAKFLDYYLQKEKNPDYAILITGSWGSGKTYFIKDYLRGEDFLLVNDWLTDCQKYCVVYVSLFGVNTKEEISRRILDKVSPNLKKLSSVPDVLSLISILAGVAVGTVLVAHGAAPIAFTAGKSIGNAVGQAGKFFTSKFLKSLEVKKNEFKKLIVVFDDVERTRLTPKELLGYINEFVECQHLPCILIADKDHWEDNANNPDDKNTLQNLSTTKEKVVGKIFKIQTSFDSVWNSWTNKDLCPVGNQTWNLLDRNLIGQIVCSSGKYNFRALKHTLLDLQRFLGCIEPKYLKCEDFNSLLIADFVCFQYAFHLGMISANDIGVNNSQDRIFAKVGNKNLSEKENEKKYPKTEYEKFEETFSSITRLSLVSENQYGERWIEIWKTWLDRNFVDSKIVNDLIFDSVWFNRKNEYELRKMYGWYMADDEDGRIAMNAFERALKEEALLKPISIMCLCYDLFWLAKRNVFKESYEDFCLKMKKYVQTVASKLEYEKVEDWKYHINLNGDIYEEIQEQLDDLQDELLTSLKPCKKTYKESQKEEFLLLLKSSSYKEYEKACRILAKDSSELEEFNFVEIDVETFCSIYQAIPAKWTSECFKALKRRYSNKKELLEGERNFLEKLLQHASKIYDNAERPLLPSVFSLYYLKRTLKEILKME